VIEMLADPRMFASSEVHHNLSPSALWLRALGLVAVIGCMMLHSYRHGRPATKARTEVPDWLHNFIQRRRGYGVWGSSPPKRLARSA